jgi:hypothetical protein
VTCSRTTLYAGLLLLVSLCRSAAGVAEKAREILSRPILHSIKYTGFQKSTPNAMQ